MVEPRSITIRSRFLLALPPVPGSSNAITPIACGPGQSRSRSRSSRLSCSHLPLASTSYMNHWEPRPRRQL